MRYIGLDGRVTPNNDCASTALGDGAGRLLSRRLVGEIVYRHGAHPREPHKVAVARPIPRDPPVMSTDFMRRI